MPGSSVLLMRPTEVRFHPGLTRNLDSHPKGQIRSELGRRTTLASLLSLSLGSFVFSSDAVDLSAEPTEDGMQNGSSPAPFCAMAAGSSLVLPLPQLHCDCDYRYCVIRVLKARGVVCLLAVPEHMSSGAAG